MKTSQILFAISFGIVAFGQGCSGKFAPIGSDQDASVTGGNSGVGGNTGVTCLYNNVRYTVGTSFKSSDGCNSCSCSSNGQVACTLMACAVGGASGLGGGSSTGCVCSGPSPESPTFQCWDGSTAGPTCATHADGTCNWTVTTCPPQPGVGGATGAGGNMGLGGGTGIQGCATAADCQGALPALCQLCSDGSNGCAHFVCLAGTCGVAYCSGNCVCSGPSPASPTFQCWDGSTAGPTCATHADGTCSWTVTTCPPQPAVGGATGAGGTTSAGGAIGVPGSGGCFSIDYIPPKCSVGTAVQTKNPTTGCPSVYVCPTCDAVPIPTVSCSNYQVVTDPTTGCPTGYICPVADASVCAPIALAIPVCANGSAVLKYDASGCATGYVCP